MTKVENFRIADLLTNKNQPASNQNFSSLPAVTRNTSDTLSNHTSQLQQTDIVKMDPGPSPKDDEVFKKLPAAGTVEESKKYLEQRRNAVVDLWASAPLEDWDGWQKKGKFKTDPSGPPKVTLPNRVNALLEKGIQTERVNEVLLSGKPYSGVGTQFQIIPGIQRKDESHIFPGLQRMGDYDFSAMAMTTVAYQHWDSPHLRDETKHHIASVLLNQEGNDHLKEKWLFGIIPETENHLLMTESSRYLKNQLVQKHGLSYSTHNLKPEAYNNELNGFNDWFVEHLSHFARADFDEYNSRPYQGYTVKAIQNMYEFAEDPRVKKSAHIMMDYLSARFATQSSDLRRVAAFRRRQGYQDHDNVLEKDAEAARHAVLAGNFNGYTNTPEGKTSFSKHNMTGAATLSYKVPDLLLDLMIEKQNNPYFMTVRHENTEIFYSEKNFMLSAGGHYHKWSNMPFSKQENGIPMPTVLMLKDDGPSLSNMIRFEGRGDNDKINNTGVYENFAFGIRPVIPEKLADQTVEKGNWKFMAIDSVYVAMHVQKQQSPDNYAPSVGFMEVVDKKGFASLNDFIKTVERNNITKKFNYYGHNLYTTTKGKTIEFEMAEPLEKNFLGKAVPPKTKEVTEWSVKKVWENGKALPIETNLEKWPLVDSKTMLPENDGENNDYIMKADGTGQILINNPHTNQSLILSLADHENPIRIEQQGELVNLSETAKVSKLKTSNTLDLNVDMARPEKVSYLSLKWDKGSKPENVKVYIQEKGNDNWKLAENRTTVFTSEKYDFRTDFDLTASPEVSKVRFVVTGKNLNMDGSPEVYEFR